MADKKTDWKAELKKFWSGVKEDPKKKALLILLPVIIVGTIIAGAVMGGGDEVVEDKEKTSSLDVPVDTMSVDNKNKSEHYKNGFFDVENPDGNLDFFSDGDSSDVNSDDSEEEDNNAGNRNYWTGGNSYSNTGSSSSNRNSGHSSSGGSGNDNSNEVVVSEETDSRRRRNPSDGLGNLGTGGSSANMYRAVVANGNQAVKSGSYVKIRVAEEIKIDGVRLPKNSVITGIANYANERMNILIRSVKVGGSTRTVEWVVYDEDGNLGIAVPRDVLDDIASDGSEEAIEQGGASVEGSVPIVGKVRVNLKKRASEVSFVVRDGHRVYIKKAK